DAISSDEAHVGQTFRASLDAPIEMDKEVLVPRNAKVFVKVVEVQSAGSLTGKSVLKVGLDKIVVGETSYSVQSNVSMSEGASQAAKTARTAGIGAAAGAIIGAIAGGKKGAVIGAGTGAGAGTAVEAVTKGEQVRIDSESEIVFRLETPLEMSVPSNL